MSKWTKSFTWNSVLFFMASVLRNNRVGKTPWSKRRYCPLNTTSLDTPGTIMLRSVVDLFMSSPLTVLISFRNVLQLDRLMNKLKITIRIQKVSTYFLLTILLTGCAADNAQHFRSSSTKMTHHTTILNHQTHRSLGATQKSSSTVDFEYEEITTQ